MADTFDPNDFKSPPPFDPTQFGTPPDVDNTTKFNEQVVNIEDLPEDKQAEYSQFLNSDQEAPPHTSDSADNEENVEEDIEKVFNALKEANKVELTDEMREAFMRSLMSNKPYSQTYTISGDDLAITFRTLTVKEYDAIADAVGKLSEETGFINANHLKFINFRYTVSSSITKIETKDEEGKIQVFNYKPPLEEDTATHKEEVMEIRQLDGTTREKTVTVPITNADRVIQAHEDRFDSINSTLYNVLLNSYSTFDREVNTLASELYSKNFTAPIETSLL